MNNKITCLIIDDEPDARELIKKFITRIPLLELAGEFGNAVDALFQIQKIKPDLIFLDVEMPEMTGFEFIRTLQGHLPKIIMITAYPQYAVDGFEHQVTDYLLKPTSFERFMRAIIKVNEQLYGQAKITTQGHSIAASQPGKLSEETKNEQIKANDFILIKEDKKLVRIVPDEILLIEAMKDYIKIYLNGRVIVTHSTMTKMESMLPEDTFLRVSRSYIIRINVIREIDGNQITTLDGKKVDIGVTYRDAVMKKLKK